MPTNLNDTTPAAPAGYINGKWQATDWYVDAEGRTVRDASVYVPQSSTSRSNVVVTTASLIDRAVEQGAASLGKTFILYRVAADRLCRVRIYNSTTAATADSARLSTTLVPTNAGLICDLVLDDSGFLNLYLEPPAFAFDVDTPDGTVAYIIENLSGSTHTVQVTFYRMVLET